MQFPFTPGLSAFWRIRCGIIYLLKIGHVPPWIYRSWDWNCRVKVVFVFSSAGHKFCQECVSRASSVAIGDGKTELHCLADCNSVFALSTLQHALSANTFSKWLSKIQLADIEKVFALISNLNRALQKPRNIFSTFIFRSESFSLSLTRTQQ